MSNLHRLVKLTTWLEMGILNLIFFNLGAFSSKEVEKVGLVQPGNEFKRRTVINVSRRALNRFDHFTLHALSDA